MPTDSADDGGDDLVDRWLDPDADLREAEQPFGDPEESGPAPETSTATSYADPEVSPDLSDADPELLNTFTICVLLANVGVLLVSVGLLVGIFRSMTTIGSGLVVVGTLVCLDLWRRYRAFKRGRATDTESDDRDDTGHNR